MNVNDITNIRKRFREDGGFDLTATAGPTTRIEKFDKHGNLQLIESHALGQCVVSTHCKRDVYLTTGPVPRLIFTEPIQGMHGYSPIRAIIPDPDVEYATHLRRHSPGPDYE